MRLNNIIAILFTSNAIKSNYYGECVSDNVQRVLSSSFFTQKDMTVEKCVHHCRQKGFSIAGVQWQIECYCGDKASTLNGRFTWLWRNRCNLPCGGNSVQNCGGYNAMNIYTSIIDAGACIYDSPDFRVFQGYSQAGIPG